MTARDDDGGACADADVTRAAALYTAMQWGHDRRLRKRDEQTHATYRHSPRRAALLNSFSAKLLYMGYAGRQGAGQEWQSGRNGSAAE